jgi:small neutral amino acid transporter SnatA (MarC family)
MELETLNATFVIDIFLLLLIGIGPKIALVPFLEATRQMPQVTQRRVLRKMLTTAATVAVLLLVLGGLLTRLLHFSPGALGVASGIILLIISVTMVLGQHDQNSGSQPPEDQDPIAVFPLAVPYLLNPAGIVVLVTASAEAASVSVVAVVVGILIVILALDVVVFRWAVQVSSHLDASRMLVTEKVFGFLLAALAVQLALDGLSDVGVIHLTGH